jgi:hypothetical protein
VPNPESRNGPHPEGRPDNQIPTTRSAPEGGTSMRRVPHRPAGPNYVGCSSVAPHASERVVARVRPVRLDPRDPYLPVTCERPEVQLLLWEPEWET